MNTDPQDAVDLGGKRWRAVRLGLRLSDPTLGFVFFFLVYFGWILVALLGMFLLIPVVLMDKIEQFVQAYETLGTYLFLVPLGAIFAMIWLVKLFAGILLCSIPRPPTAAFLALVGVIGRISVLVGIGYMRFSAEPLGKALLLPQIMACSAMAWLGLAAEWAFFRRLRQHFLPASDFMAPDGQSAIEERTERRKGIFKRDVGKWFKGRYPRAYGVVTWIGLPLFYLALFWMQNPDNPGSFFEGALRLAIFYPLVLQIFLIFNKQSRQLMFALAPGSVGQAVPSAAV